MASWFGSSTEIDILLEDAPTRKQAELRNDEGVKRRLYLFYDGESIRGKVNVSLKNNKKVEHHGIRIEFIGQIELYYDRGSRYEFVSLTQLLAPPGELLTSSSYPFAFNAVEKPYESYVGTNVKLRYLLRVTVLKRITNITKEMELCVHTLSHYSDYGNQSIRMEVGIEDSLHIEFEYNRSKYHLRDAIVGKIYFLLVRIKIKHMEIQIIKRETAGISAPSQLTDNDTIVKYEIMDGGPARGESIPIRLFLAGYDLPPTMRDVQRKFSVRYFLNLVLVDEEDRRYFKQQEIILWRKGELKRRTYQQQSITTKEMGDALPAAVVAPTSSPPLATVNNNTNSHDPAGEDSGPTSDS